MKCLKTITAIVALYACSIMALWAQAPYGQTSGQPWEAKYFHATIASGINPGENWYATDFDDSAWGTIAGPISNTSDLTYHTPWEGDYTAYWVRRSFTIDALSEVGAAYLRTIHDDGCLIYLNGHLIYENDNVQGDANYEVLLTEEQIGYLNEGENLLAVYVSNSFGGNAYMDFGLEVATAENGIIYRGTVAYQLADRERTEYTIKERTTHINNDLFNGCSNMTSISIPSSVVSIGDNAFSGCSSLPVEGYIRYADCFAIEVTDQGQSTYTLKEGTRFLNNSLFSYCRQLESITIPEGIQEIKSQTFIYCNRLTNITLPEGITKIGPHAFQYCSSLTDITLPEGLTTIEDWTFGGCSSLTNITLPESLTSIYEDSFNGCHSLPVENGIRYADWYAVERTEDLSEYTLKTGTRLIRKSLFIYYEGLKTITLPEGLLEISAYAFYDCHNLRTVNLPSSLRAVGNHAFRFCPQCKPPRGC